MNCFGIEIGIVRFVSPRAQSLIWQRICYLTLSSLLLNTSCVIVITGCRSSNHLHHQWIGRQNKKLEIKCITEWVEKMMFHGKKCAAGQMFLWNKMRHRQDLSNRLRRMKEFLTESLWVVCPIDTMCNSFFTNYIPESTFFNSSINWWINLLMNEWITPQKNMPKSMYEKMIPKLGLLLL